MIGEGNVSWVDAEDFPELGEEIDRRKPKKKF